MKRFILLFNTLRYLKWQQIFYRVFYSIHKPRLCRVSDFTVREGFGPWQGSKFAAPATLDGKTFTFLGESAVLQKSWGSSDVSKLWLYNLHYQDDLNAVGAEACQRLNDQLIDSWIAANPPISGDGWEPYCISLRIVNWVKWFSHRDPQQLKPLWHQSLFSQADVLMQRLEFHILGNHLFANAKALIFVGSYFSGRKSDLWLKKGLQILDKELSEQFLDDGAHFELSPMYHATLLWDLADLIVLAEETELREIQELSKAWRQRFVKGLGWLQAMVHPDGDIPFFNDAAFGIAPTFTALIAYADKLGIQVTRSASCIDFRAQLFEDSGYAVVDWPQGHKLLVDVARIAPDYQPGHAHADTLSCELSLFGHRVLVNSGVSQYGEDAERHRQRSTAAHNTVEVDSENSSEVWAGFRVARRARPQGIELKANQNRIYIEGSHTGYRRLPGRVTHYRSWEALADSLIIRDNLVGVFTVAIVHWHFHPDVRVVREGDSTFRIRLPQRYRAEFRSIVGAKDEGHCDEEPQEAFVYVEGATANLVSSTWHPRFGVTVANQKLELFMNATQVSTKITWKSLCF